MHLTGFALLRSAGLRVMCQLLGSRSFEFSCTLKLCLVNCV